jgi:hypothetical protein
MRVTAIYSLLLLGLFTLVDFAVSQEADHVVHKVSRILQSHNNASGNFHYAYKVITDKREVFVSQSFASLIEEGRPIQIYHSAVLGVVNRVCYGNQCETYSLRWFTGLAIPILAIALVIFDRKFKILPDTIVGIMLVVATANIIGLYFLR